MTEPGELKVLVVGAGRGLGRGVAAAFANSGNDVVALARDGASLAGLTDIHPTVRTHVADASDADAVRRVLDEHQPNTVIVVAGATPVMRALVHQSWETFSVNWDADVKIAFTWAREALLKPLPRGSKVVIVSSGAALNGSPLSGGYAGSKATQRFIAQYAQLESERADLGITFTTVMPRMTPAGDVGRAGIRAYARQAGSTEDAFIQQLEPVITPEIAGQAMVDLVNRDTADSAAGYVLTGVGLAPLT
ncbi:SDR family NAD(P)-dependent oxidoreductase [Mycolicibacterium rhodesiae]|uniref:Short-chain dehydrogenase n=1 Tax=Mycolicibacterium rhodesiae TaxID=36814 RepID=A0A1X0J5V7_MYCRH|nr:SDR family oxidoreductase [Mycolicibacterium rhodesiae]MCV7348239.1 SDR family oxidoreductase [Mycolicibacterium rhodesiae]ORB57414.1 short-chain dehydrogenase [Mycolicibacterium rhodesiae]